MVIVVANRIPVAKGWEEAFERRWLNRKWSIATLPGFLGTEVLRPMKGDVYVVQTHWRSMKDFERWTKSAAFGEAHAALRKGDLTAAWEALGRAEAAKPGDGPTAWLVALAGRMRKGDQPSPWDGTWRLTEK